MNDSTLALFFSLASVVATIVMLVRYYEARIDEARQEANFWRRKSEQLEKPGA